MDPVMELQDTSKASQTQKSKRTLLSNGQMPQARSSWD
jgi:hypothetical protein